MAITGHDCTAVLQSQHAVLWLLLRTRSLLYGLIELVLLCFWRWPALQPHAVSAKKLGVGACAWEGEVLMAAYLVGEGYLIVKQQTVDSTIATPRTRPIKSMVMDSSMPER